MLLLYYTNTILFWLSLPTFNKNPSPVKQLDKHDLLYLPQEVCIAQCLGRTAKSSSTSISTSTPEPVNISPQPQHYQQQQQQQEKEQGHILPVQPLKDAFDHLVLLKKLEKKSLLEHCMEYCRKEQAVGDQDTTTVKQIHENYGLNLICRDESSLNFRINLHATKYANTENSSKKLAETDVKMTATGIETIKEVNLSLPSLLSSASSASSSSSSLSSSTYHKDDGKDKDVVLFVIKIHLANETDAYNVYLSDDEFFTIVQLLPNTTYNVTVFAVHSHSQYSVIALAEQFQTLRRGYSPGNITHIKVINFIEDTLNPTHLSATVIWKPPADMTCYYDVICFSPISNDFEMQPVEIRNPRQLYKYQLDNLTFSTEYKVGIRAKNIKNMKESDLFWKTFYAPSCGEWHNFNFNVCAPDAPGNLQYQLYYVSQNVYSLNVSWNKPTHYPDSYTLSVNDLSPYGQVYLFNISKNVNNFFIEEIKIFSAYFDVLLMASTVGGNATSLAVKNADAVIHIPEKNNFVKYFVVILASIFCVALLAMTIFILYYRRAKLKRYQERCKYFEELEKKAPIEPKDNFDFAISVNASKRGHSNDLNIAIETDDTAITALFNDNMEIERSQLTLYEILGEGAFGLVKRGIYKDNREQGGAVHEVAVKMLKDQPSSDDVRAFRREIEVMKSVERHPNIVGILGHCTRFSNEMMLLTEYCSLGNLLNFLRDEWRFLHELQQKQQKLNPTKIVSVKLPLLLFDFEDTTYKAIRSSCKISNTMQSISPPPSPAPPPPVTLRNSPLKMLLNSQCPSRVEELENTKNSQNKVSSTAVEDKEEIITSNNKQILIDQFQRKYNSFKQHYKDREMAGYSSGWRGKLYAGLESLKGSSTKSNVPQFAMQENGVKHPHHKKTTTISPLTSPATENKSYGYHGYCTSSCKCNVDVIISNIDSSDAAKELEELDRLLQQQQDKQLQQQKTLNKSCATTIAIKNCDCRKHKSPAGSSLANPASTPSSLPSHIAHKHKIAIENKSYFKIFNSDRKVKSHRQRSIRESHRITNTKGSKSIPQGNELTRTNNEALTTVSGVDEIDDEGIEDSDNWLQRVPLKAQDLLDIARQVAVGMDFLSKNKVVHRDLAARNVLVAPDRTIKIADFGLSRDVYQENIYKKTGNGKLPIKWLALESLTHQVYTTQSDVWAYGILLYEIVTLGATPYPSIPTNRLLHLLKTGYRMERPKNCGNKFYALMHSCWSAVPNERPTFSIIVKTLEDMLDRTTVSLLEYPHSPTTYECKHDEQYHLRCKENDDEDEDKVDNDNDTNNDEDRDKQATPTSLKICPDDAYLNPLL